MKSLTKTRSKHRLRVCVAFSSGGHYMETMQLMDTLKEFDTFYVTVFAPTTRDLPKTYYLKDSAIGVLRSMILNSFISLKVILKEKPHVVLTTGAEIVIPLCYLCKILFRTKIIFLETFARITSPSFTGKMVYPIADLFIVQWPSLLKFYGAKAKYIGRVF